MKICKLEIYHTKVPLKKTYTMSHAVGSIDVTEPIVVKIQTDDGIFGYGETDVIPGFSDETPETIMQVLIKNLGPKVLGADPLNLSKLHRDMDQAVRGNYAAKAAIDMACYDIFGKSCGMPIYKLLGGALREKIPMMRAVGDDSPQNNANEILAYRQQGYNTVMIKVGSSNVEYDAERVRTVREALGKDYRIIVDVNQGWDAETAIKFCKLIRQCEIDLFEQPVPGWDVDSLARIRRKVDIPVSADEGVQTIHDAKHLIQKDAVDVFSIKVAKHGGIHRTKQIMELADVFGIRCLMNSMLEEGITEAASLQLGAVATNLMDVGHAYFSPLRLDDDITTYSAQLKDGFVSISEKPGLGVEIRQDILKKYVFQSRTIA